MPDELTHEPASDTPETTDTTNPADAAETPDYAAQLAELRAQLAAAHADRETALRVELAAVAAEREAARTEHAAALARYRERLVADLPATAHHLVVGDTLADIDAAAGRARDLVAEIARTQAAAAAAHVPAAGTTRQPPDYSGLSPGEKLRAAIAERLAR